MTEILGMLGGLRRTKQNGAGSTTGYERVVAGLDQERAEAIAREAIEAMRDPTEGMYKAGAAKWDDDWCTETNALNMWHAMVDEALKTP